MPEPAPERSALSAGSPVRRWLPWAALAVVVVTCLSIAAFGSTGTPTPQDRVAAIAKTIKCPTCSGESVAESNAPASQEIRADIAERVQNGQGDGDIRAYYAGRYGDAILLTPSASGVNALIWILPVVAFAVAVAGLVVVFRRWSGEAPAHASAADRALVEAALRREHEQAVEADDAHGEGSSR